MSYTFFGSATSFKDVANQPCIYILAEEGSEYVKIGFTNALAARITDLQVGNPRLLTVIGLLHGDERTETALHLAFAASAVRGEWYRRTPEIDELISGNQLSLPSTEAKAGEAHPAAEKNIVLNPAELEEIKVISNKFASPCKKCARIMLMGEQVVWIIPKRIAVCLTCHNKHFGSQ